MSESCLSCKKPIEDEECYQIKDRNGGELGYIHVECHSAYTDNQRIDKLGQAFISIMNFIYSSDEKDAQKFIISKWKSTDTNSYDKEKIQRYKNDYETRGPSGQMINDLLKNFSGHPNAIRIFVEVMFKNPHYREKAREGVDKNKNNPLLFDLLMLEATKKILEGDMLIADKMLTVAYTIDKRKAEKAILHLMNEKVYMPRKIYQNSPLARVLNSSDTKIALSIIQALPSDCEWKTKDFFNTMTGAEIIAGKIEVMEVIEKYKDNMKAWCDMAGSLFLKPEVYQNIEMVTLIGSNTNDILDMGTIFREIDKSERLWSRELEDFVTCMSLDAYNMNDKIDELRKKLENTPHWDEGCTNAFFRILEPDMYNALNDGRTIFDEYEETLFDEYEDF